MDNITKESRERIRSIWKGMKRRCEKEQCPGFKNYGGKGVFVCEEWQSFDNFMKWSLENGYDDSLTIDRIDSDGIYEPSNCKWSNRIDQNNNTSRNHYVEVDGCIYTVAELSRIYGIKQNTLLYRLRRGWSVERAIGQEVQKHG